MTRLYKPVKRTGCGLIRERGQPREIVVILRPPNVIGFRAKGCRQEYQLTTEVCYRLAVQAHVLLKARECRERRKHK